MSFAEALLKAVTCGFKVDVHSTTVSGNKDPLYLQIDVSLRSSHLMDIKWANLPLEALTPETIDITMANTLNDLVEDNEE